MSARSSDAFPAKVNSSSKFVILEALDLAFGESVKFVGVLLGIVWLIVVVVTMVIVEELVVRFYRRLA